MQVVIRHDDGTEQEVTDAVKAMIQLTWPVITKAVAEMTDLLYPERVAQTEEIQRPFVG